MVQKISLAILSFFLPAVAFAAQGITGNIGAIGTSLSAVINFINSILVPLVFALAFLFFLWGLFKFFFWNSEEGKESGKQLMLWGIIAFVVMVSVWGIVNLLSSSLGINDKSIDTVIPIAPKTR